MNFPCTKCGACCRRSYLLPFFIYTDIKTGICSKLENNLCSIYYQRPDICNINKINVLSFKGTLQEYYKVSAVMCNKFIKEDKMDKTYLINLHQFKD